MKLLIINIIIGYVILLFIAYFLSDSLTFFPPRAGYQKNSPGFIQLRTKDGAKIFAYYLHNKDAKYTLLVSHGNAEDIGYMVPFFQEMYKHGFSVLGYDYHGYGLSEGRPTERTVYLDVDAAYDYLTKDLHIAPDRIIAWGHSVGAAVALDLAVRRPVAAVILQGAFVTAFRVLTRVPIIPFDKFNNLRKIKELKCPLLMIHGTSDTIIPFWHGEKLYRAAPVVKQFYMVQNANHNDLLVVAGEGYWQAISSFIKQNLTKQ